MSRGVGHVIAGAAFAMLAACADGNPPDPVAVAASEPDAPAAPVAIPAVPADNIAVLILSSAGVGPVRLGMTLAEARVALPDARLERASDGVGVAWVAVMRGEDALMSLHAGEEDPEAPIDDAATILAIETFSPAVATAEGVAVGWRVDDAARIYGPVRKVTRGEIEQREYIDFANQPAGMTFRIDYTGVFAPGENESTRYAPDARIFSIAVDAPSAGD